MRTEKPFDILEKKILDCSKTVPRRSNMITFWDTCDTCLHISILINSTRENNNKNKYRYMACWYFTLTILYINSKQIFTYVPKHTECILLFNKYLEQPFWKEHLPHEEQMGRFQSRLKSHICIFVYLFLVVFSLIRFCTKGSILWS